MRLLHTETVPIRWGDMDAMGHVNNTIYFRYMEQARISWLGSVGMLVGENADGATVIHTSCTFLKQLVYPGDVEVRLYAGEVGRSSFHTRSEMRPSTDPGVLYAEGTAKLVWVDHRKGKSMPLPERLRALIAA